MALMRAILDTQVEDSEVPDIKIMSQVYLPMKNKQCLKLYKFQFVL